jgi:hypothetical protein
MIWLLPILGSHFAWFGDTEQLVAGGVEAELRATEHVDLGDTRIRDTILFTGLRFGATDSLELTFSADVASTSAVGLQQEFALRDYAGSVRYRFLRRTATVVPATRLTLVRDGVRRDVIHAELDATIVGTYDRFVGAAELGYVIDANKGGGFRQRLRTNLAVGVLPLPSLTTAVELHGEFDKESGATDWIVAGPTVAWARGRFWLSAHYGFGVSGIGHASRIAWAFSF